MQVKRFLIIIVILCCSFIFHTAQAAVPLPIIVDTDGSTDDAMALFYLLNNPNVAVKAIIVDRNAGSHAKTAAAHIGYLLQLANFPNIPVYIGLNKKPQYQAAYSEEVLNLTDGAYQNTTVQPKLLINQAQLAKLISAQSQPLQILSLGSLTNIDDLFQNYPQVKSHIQSMTIMGGALEVRGNIIIVSPDSKNTYAELNIMVDPEAFQKVLASSIPITLVTLDVTNKALVTTAFLDRLKLIDTAKAKFIYHLLSLNSYYIQNNNYDFWDPLAAFVIANPNEVSTKDSMISTNTRPGDHYGQIQESPEGYPVSVVTNINQQALETAILQSLS